MTTEYTARLRLNKPDFRSVPWSPLVNQNWDALDEAIGNVLANAGFLPWANNTLFSVTDIAIDTSTTPSSYWVSNVTHTTPMTGTFADERAAHPTYWTSFIFRYNPRGAWTHDTPYLVGDIAYDATLGITGIVKTSHTSNHSGTINTDAAYWDFIVFLPGTLPATSITFDPTVSTLTATDVQDAIDTLDAIVDMAVSGLATVVANNTANGLTNISNFEARIAAIEAQLPKTGAMILTHNPTPATGWIRASTVAGDVDGTIGNAASGGTIRANADTLALFSLYWNNYLNTQCPVSGGRGASAAVDFAANKTIAIPKLAGRSFIAHGNGTGLTGRGSGSIGGEESHALTAGELAPHTHGYSGTTAGQNQNHNHNYTSPNGNTSTGGGGFPCAGAITTTTTGVENQAFTHNYSGNTDTGAGVAGTAHNNMQPFSVMFVHIKL